MCSNPDILLDDERQMQYFLVLLEYFQRFRRRRIGNKYAFFKLLYPNVLRLCVANMLENLISFAGCQDLKVIGKEIKRQL